MFELFAIVAVLVSVGTTAYLAIALLHNDEAISDRILTQTATPLIFAVFLLVLVSVLGRLPGSVERVFSVLPLILIAGAVAAWLASSAWSFQPGRNGADGRPHPRCRRAHRPARLGRRTAHAAVLPSP